MTRPTVRCAFPVRLVQAGSATAKAVSPNDDSRSTGVSRFYWVLHRLRPRLTLSADNVFEARQLLDADGSTGMQLSRADADLRTHSEFAPVGELRRCVPQHDRGIQSRKKLLRRKWIVGHDAFGMLRAEGLYVADGGLDTVHRAHGDDGIEKFGAPVGVVCRLCRWHNCPNGIVRANLAARRHEVPEY